VLLCRMHGALLAFLLLTSTVDPRLAEPVRLLAEVGARDTTDGHPARSSPTCSRRSARRCPVIVVTRIT